MCITKTLQNYLWRFNSKHLPMTNYFLFFPKNQLPLKEVFRFDIKKKYLNMKPVNTLFSEFETATTADWIADSLKTAKITSLEALQTKTYEGIVLKPFYTRENAPSTDLSPDDFPDKWYNREQLTAPNSPQQLLAKGATALAIDFSNNFDEQLLGKALEKVPLHFVLQDDVKDISLLKNYKGVASIDIDYLSRWIYTGNKPAQFGGYLIDLLQNTSHRVVYINAQGFGNTGANAVQELAFAVSMFVEYADELTEKGIATEKIFAQAAFSFSIGGNYFMEIAKFRAIRLLWKRLLQAYQTEAMPCYVHAQSSLLNKSNLDAYNNMIRATSEAMSAVVGGVNALTTLPYNASFETSDDFAQRIARNVSTILASEAHFDKVKDISAGTYYIEALTQQLTDKSWELFLATEKEGGFVKAFEAGFVQKSILQIAQERKQDFRTQKNIQVGVNKFKNPKELANPLQATKSQQQTTNPSAVQCLKPLEWEID